MNQKVLLRNTHVLYLHKHSSLGGASYSLRLLIEALKPHGIRPVVITSRQGWLSQMLQQMYVPCEFVNFRHWNFPSLISNLTLAFSLKKFIYSYKIDLIHANEHWVGPVGLIVAMLTKRPIICHFRTGLKDLSTKRIFKYMLPFYDAVITVAKVLANRLEGFVKEERLFTVYNPVYVTQSPKFVLPSHKKIVICIGTISPIKGQEKILQGCIPWLKQSKDNYLLFVGRQDDHPQYVDSLRKTINKHGLENNVLLLGPRLDIQDLLNQSFALVAYSRIEGVPRVVMEAMGQGRPCIVSNTAGMDEIIENGKTGFMINFEINPTEVSEVLVNLQEPEKWKQISLNAWRFAFERFRPELCARNIVKIYKRILR